jgi:hypothetical protein
VDTQTATTVIMITLFCVYTVENFLWEIMHVKGTRKGRHPS